MFAPYLTVGQLGQWLAERHGLYLQHWQLDRLIRRGTLPSPTRIGCYRTYPAADLPAVEAALTSAGYLPAAREGVPA